MENLSFPKSVLLYIGDAVEVLRDLPSSSIDTVITSPPYYKQRIYGHPGEIGQEESVEDYREFNIINAGKSGRGRDIRYAYCRCPYFKLLSTPSNFLYRVEFVHLNPEKSQEEIARIRGKKYRLPVHFRFPTE